MAEDAPLNEFMDCHTMAASTDLARAEDGGVRCAACCNRCLIREGERGVCQVRFNRGGELQVPAGYVAGLQVDPIEKKPFFHVYPGQDALSFGMLGCNLHCSFCQNWVSSQTLRDEEAGSRPHAMDADGIVALAVQHGAPVVVSTYNEPLITSEWAHQVFEKAQEKGLVCGFVSNGNATPEVLEYLRPVMDLYKVDLKTFDQARYRELGASLRDILDAIVRMKTLGFWVEIVTLVVPGFNDDPVQLNGIARFIAGISPDIPWHVTAFHPDYQMTGGRRTSSADLRGAYDAGKDAGLRFVYAGNLPGAVQNCENTYCPSCGEVLVERCGFRVLANRLRNGQCPSCRTDIPGRWE